MTKITRAKLPELGWSGHMPGEWMTQLQRVRRWHERAVQGDVADQQDFLYAFFENALHLRDWLLATKGATRKEIDTLFASRVEMRLCRDLANAHKHFSIHNPSQPTPPSEVREYVPGRRNQATSTAFAVLSDGARYNLVDLANSVLNIWLAFLDDRLAATANPT